jgi:LuxR family quorum-sensing transcriptional regulator LasR
MNRLNQKPATSSIDFQSTQTKETPSVKLTTKERETLEWMALGKSAWEVSRILGKSEAAVNFHLCNIRRKFNVTTLRSALVKAIEQGIILLH